MNPVPYSNTRLTSEELDALGYSDLTEEQKFAIIVAAHHALEIRVGEELSTNLSKQQMTEFERILTQPDADQNSLHWLIQNMPAYRQVVSRQQRQLREELAKITSDFHTHFSPEHEPLRDSSRNSSSLDDHHKTVADT